MTQDTVDRVRTICTILAGSILLAVGAALLAFGAWSTPLRFMPVGLFCGGAGTITGELFRLIWKRSRHYKAVKELR